MVSEKKSKMSQPIRGLCGHLVVLVFFFDRPEKNTNLEEGVEILLPVSSFVEFYSAVSAEVENASANQRLVLSSCFFRSARKKTTNLVEGVKILLPVKFR